MAKKSLMKTPKTPMPRDSQLLSPIKSGQPYSAVLDDDTALLGDETITHLGSDLPDVPSQTDDLQTPDLAGNDAGSIASHIRTTPFARTPVTIMGANNSREEINAAVHATARELQSRDAARPSTGKLKRPSSGLLNPPYRNPAEHAAARQRRMHGGHQARQDTYDVVDSPKKPTPQLRTKRVEHTHAISPLKKQRKVATKKQEVKTAFPRLAESHAKTQRQVDAQLLGSTVEQTQQEEAVSSPRRSTRRTAAADHAQAQAVPGADEAGSAQTSRNKASFRDRIGATVQKDVLTPPEQESVKTADELDDEALEAQLGEELEEVDQRAENIVQQASPRQEQAKTGPGRPRKSASTAKSKHVVEAVEVPASDPEPRTRGQKAASLSPQRSRQGVSAKRERLLNELKEQKKSEARARASRAPIAKTAAALECGIKERKNAESRRSQARREEEDYVPRYEDEDEQHAEAEEVDGDEEDETSGDDELPERVPTRAPQKQKVVTARPRELFSDATGAPLSEPEASPEKRPRPRKRRREENEERPTANESRKRTRVMAADATPAEAAEDITDADRHRLYGQWPALRVVFKATKNIGVQHLAGERQPQWQIKLKDDEVIAIFNSGNGALTKVINGQDPAGELVDVVEKVDALYDVSREPNFKDKVRVKNIYYHLFPQLVRLVWHMVGCYEASDAGVEPDSPLAKGHLRHVKELIKVIIDLGDGAQKYERPRAELCLLQPVKNGIVAPLKKIHAALTRALVSLEQAAAYRLQRQREAERVALDTQREEQKARQAEQVKRARKKWQQLHFERVCAEGGIMNRQKRQHLCCVPEPVPEYDENGAPFERIEVFHPRIGPSPAAVERARKLIWPLAHCNALADGSREYRGPDVFEKIFRRYCPRGQILNAYNVTEIVTCAADLREWLEEGQGEGGRGVEEWVRGIPVWTKGHPLGKENEGTLDNDGGLDES